jgi:ribosomal protein S18 acetylase RimI-like enzyme
MKYKESTSKNLDIAQINALRKSVGWFGRTNKKWEEILSKSSFVYSIWDGKKLIGMGRLVEDGIMCMFYDIVVHKDYQGKGLGKKIVEKFLNKIKNKKYISIGLFTDKNKVKFYKKLGFTIAVVAMEYNKFMENN